MSNTLPTINEEQQALQIELDKITSHPKLALWLKYFLDKSNTETYGNRTQSAIKAYNLDPIEQYAVAGSMGYQNFKKLQTITMLYYETEGMTASKVLDLIAAKAVSTNNAKYGQMLAELTGVYEPKATVAIQNNTFTNIQVTKEEAKAFETDFEKFIDAKYSQPTQPSNQQEASQPIVD